MRRRAVAFVVLATTALLVIGVGPVAAQSDWTLIGWNDLGMHCMDADYSVFAILPPYNTIHAQLVDASGRLVTDPGGITVTYQAVADPSGSINATSAGKTNFWDFVARAVRRGSPPVDEGLAGYDMPGSANRRSRWPGMPGLTAGSPPRACRSRRRRRLGGTSLPDDAPGTARDGSGAVLATTDIVLPVSDEMDCRACHGSGSARRPPGRSTAGSTTPIRCSTTAATSCACTTTTGPSAPRSRRPRPQVGYDPQGLEATVAGGTPILCAACHASNALPGTGVAGLPPLTRSVHAYHASVHDPVAGGTLDDSDNRSACYRCHPGIDDPLPARRHGPRGRQRRAVRHAVPELPRRHGPGGRRRPRRLARAAGLPELPHRHRGRQQRADPLPVGLRQRRRVAAAGRRHLRHQPRHPVGRASGSTASRSATAACSARRATARPTPRFPRSEVNDNVQAEQLQGHVGPLAECTACHGSAPSTVDGGPHGMHPIGQRWVERPPRRDRRRPATLPGVPRHRLPGHGAVTVAGRPHAVDRALRHQALLARLPDRLLHLPQRSEQRVAEPQSPTGGGRRHRHRDGRRGGVRPADGDRRRRSTPSALRVVSQPSGRVPRGWSDTPPGIGRSRISRAATASASPPGTAWPTPTSATSPSP